MIFKRTDQKHSAIALPSRRDFRLSQGIKYTPQDLTQKAAENTHALITIPPIPYTTGFTAQFVEVKFKHITLTTNVHIWPDKFSEETDFIENSVE